jgi:NADH dehydrogenase
VWGYRSLVRRLRRRIDRGEVRITVISASRHHAFHGWTGEVLNGLVRYERTRTPLADLMPRARIVHGRVEAVDLDTRTVTYRSGEGSGPITYDGITDNQVAYDQLLVGVGSYDATGRIPGLATHGWSVKTDGGLLAMRDQLASVLERAAASGDADERQRLLSFVVAGGGFAGVEMAAAIAELYERRTKDHPVLADHPPRVTLVHSGTELLPEVRPRFARLADYATAQLARIGVEVRVGARVEEVTPEGAVLTGGVVVPAATVLSTVGQAQVPLAGTERVIRDAAGRMVTDSYLRTSVSGVWAGGDTAAVPHVVSGESCPPNALWAIKHGVRAGDNIGRTEAGRRLRRFRFLGLGQAASLGVGRGAAELFGIQLTGWVAWVARWGFFHFFMPSRRRTVTTIGEWLAIPFRGRHFDDAPVSPVAPDLQPATGSEPAPDPRATIAA